MNTTISLILITASFFTGLCTGIILEQWFTHTKTNKTNKKKRNN